MATHKVTALATRKSTPLASPTHQTTTRPRHRQRGRNRKLSKLDEIGMVALDIDRGKGSQDRGSEEFLEKVLAVSYSAGMLDLFERFGPEFGDTDFTDYEQRFIALSQFTATLLEAAKLCGYA